MKGLTWGCAAVMSSALLLSSYLHAQEVYDELEGWVVYDDCCCCYPCEAGDWFFQADLLVWTAQQGDINSFITTDTRTSFIDQGGEQLTFTSSNLSQEGRISFDWNAGCRLGAGYAFCDGWSALAAWTHYHGSAHGYSKQSGAGASGAWKLHYDVVDALLASPYYCTWDCVKWNVFGGAKVGWIEQKMHATNQSLSVTIESDGETTTTNVISGTDFLHYSSDLTAAGPEIGLNVIWDIGCGFSLYGNAAGSVLNAHFKNKVNDEGEFSNTTDGITSSTANSTYDVTDRDHIFRFVIDLGLGLSWSHCCKWCGHEYPVMLRVGWEQHSWFDHLDSSVGDLSLNGVTLSAAVRF